MDIVQRLIVVVLLLVGSAQAATYPAFYSIPGGGVLGSGASSGSTREAAAQAFMAARQNIPLSASCSSADPGAKRKVTAYEYNNTTVWFTYVDAPCSGVFSSNASQWSYGFQTICPTGTLSGSTCTYTCPSGQSLNPVTGLCRVECPSANTQLLPSGTVREAGNGLTSTICLAGCEASAFMAAKQDGKNYVWGPIRATGRVCSELSPGPAVATETSPQCPVGKCPGTINGQSICVPCAETKQDTKVSSSETAASAASGAAPGPGQTTTQSGSSSTTCAGDTCTTTGQQTVNNPDGSSETKTTTTTQSKGDYCKENPNAGACKGSESSWGGTCDGFTCDGDAVQCAQAKGAWELACTLKTDPSSAVVQTGQQAVAGTLSDSKPVETTASIGQFNTQNPYTGTCPQDVTVSVWGKSFGIPLSQTCSWIQAVGWFLVAGATLAGARIAFT